MYGRYSAVDSLNKALLILWIILAVLNIFISNIFFYILTLVPPVFVIFRMMSKNTYKRSKENQIFLKYCSKAKVWFVLQQNKFKDRKTKRYLTCPNCKATVRVPNKKGEHTICCPKCRKDFTKKILF